MNSLFPTMLERPRGKRLVRIYLYWLFGFWFVPFMLQRLLLVDAAENVRQRAIFETACYGMHFLAGVLLLRRYLADAFFMAKVYARQVLKTAVICAVLMCTLSGGVFLIGVAVQSDPLILALRSIAPLPVFEVVLLSGDFLLHSPWLGSLTMILFAPVAICCLLYAPCFAVSCSRHPYGAYAAMSAMLLLVRWMNFQSLGQEAVLFLAQLPLHWIACWGYQKTDCIWTPILSIGCVNILACTALVILRVFVM